MSPESGVVMETLRQAIGQRDALLLTIPETTRLDLNSFTRVLLNSNIQH